MRAGMPHADFRLELEKIIARIQEQINPTIVIVNVYHMSAYHYYPPFDKGSVENTQQYNAMLEAFAHEHGFVYADIWQAEGQKDYLINPDTVHANKVGNMIIANKIFEAIVLAAPGISDNVQKRDATTEWTKGCLKIQKQSVEKSHKSY
jgi:lysophospholipase L1-like esterase